MSIASRRHERHNHIAAIRGGELLLMRYRPPAIGAPILREPAYLFASSSILSSSHIIKRFGGVRQPAAAMPQTAAQTGGIFPAARLLRCAATCGVDQACSSSRNQSRTTNHRCSFETQHAHRTLSSFAGQGGVADSRLCRTRSSYERRHPALRAKYWQKVSPNSATADSSLLSLQRNRMTKDFLRIRHLFQG